MGERLETLRADLDRTDAELLAALGLRVALCRRIAGYKREHGVPMMQPHRIDVVHQRAARYAEANGLDPTFIKQLYDLIIGETCRIEDLIIDADAEPPSPVSVVERSDGSRVPCA